MRILFNQGTPAPLRHALVGHAVETAYERGWAAYKNGELIAAAKAAGFDTLVTTDKNLKCQQNLLSRTMAIVVLQTTSWSRLQRVLSQVVLAVAKAANGTYTEVSIE